MTEPLAMKNRLILPMFLLLAALAGHAQDGGVRYLQIEAPLDMMSFRALHEAVNNLDPNGVVYDHFDDRTIIQFNIDPSVNDMELRQAIAQAGITVLPGTPVVVRQEPVYVSPDGRPLYVVTGDAAADRARYQQAIEQWNLSHPNDQLQMPLHGEDQ
jgi:hypothetical protein